MQEDDFKPGDEIVWVYPSEQKKKSRKVSKTTRPAEAKLKLILECPAELGPVARQEWDRLIRELMTSDTVTLKEVDRGPLAIYCSAYAQWLETTDSIQKYGAVMKSPNGFPVQSPYVSIANQLAATMIRIATEFGFTPASRSRIPPPPKDGWPFIDVEELK
jgi:P27 family predicted phage terminase small subunit